MTSRSRFLVGILCGLLAFPVLATHRTIAVAVTPSVLVAKSKGQPWVTVHANVSIAEVDLDTARLTVLAKDGSSITLAPLRLFADECGDLVAKFDGHRIGAVLTKPQKATFMFAVMRLDGTVFSGSAVVRVK